MRQTEVIRRHISDIFEVGPGDKNIQPTVIIIIPKPGRKAGQRLRDTCLQSDISELPSAFRVPVRGFRAVIVVKNIQLASAREVQVRPAIVVIISAGDAFDKSDVRHSRAGSAFGKGAVSIVAIQLTWVNFPVPDSLPMKRSIQPSLLKSNQVAVCVG